MFLVIFGYIMSILINKGIYNKLLVIKFKNSSYYHKSYLIGSISILSKLWEVIVIAIKKDNFPIIALISGLLSYILLVVILTKISSVTYIDSFFYGAMLNCTVQYILFSLRGHVLLKLGIRNIIFELIRSMFLVYIFSSIAYNIN